MPVLLTGAHGVVGTAVTAHSTADFVLLDRREAPDELRDGTPHPHRDRDTAVLDVGDPDGVESLAAVMDDRGVDAVVHLAGAPTTSEPYAAVERNNVRGTRNVLEAASRAGVDTFVFASSNHAVGMYETEHAPEPYDPNYGFTVDHGAPIRLDSDYGASKAASSRCSTGSATTQTRRSTSSTPAIGSGTTPSIWGTGRPNRRYSPIS